MAKIKSIRQKIAEEQFSEAYPLGADAVNIDMRNGLNLEEKMSSVDRLIEGKSPINHASNGTGYGVGTDELYGHLKITDDFSKESAESDTTAISQKGIVNMFNQYLLNILKVFYIIDEDTLLSVLNTGWVRDDELDRLTILKDYYRIEKDDDGNDILMTVDITNEKMGEKFGVVGERFNMYSLSTAWLVNDATIRLVADYFDIGMVNGELTLTVK